MENYYMLRICRQSLAQLVKPHVNNTFTTTFKLFSVIFFQPVASKFIFQTLIKKNWLRWLILGPHRSTAFIYEYLSYGSESNYHRNADNR